MKFGCCYENRDGQQYVYLGRCKDPLRSGRLGYVFAISKTSDFSKDNFCERLNNILDFIKNQSFRPLSEIETSKKISGIDIKILINIPSFNVNNSSDNFIFLQDDENFKNNFKIQFQSIINENYIKFFIEKDMLRIENNHNKIIRSPIWYWRPYS